MENKIIMENAGLIVSIFALLFTLFTYFYHDFKIKKQTDRINKYQLEKIEREMISEKKAIIEANVIKNKTNERLIKIYNRGKSIAKNVIITIPEMDGYVVKNNPCPIDLKPQSGIDISLSTFICASNKIDIIYEWSDDFSEKNNGAQTIQL